MKRHWTQTPAGRLRMKEIAKHRHANGTPVRRTPVRTAGRATKGAAALMIVYTTEEGKPTVQEFRHQAYGYSSETRTIGPLEPIAPDRIIFTDGLLTIYRA